MDFQKTVQQHADREDEEARREKQLQLEYKQRAIRLNNEMTGQFGGETIARFEMNQQSLTIVTDDGEVIKVEMSEECECAVMTINGKHPDCMC